MSLFSRKPPPALELDPSTDFGAQLAAFPAQPGAPLTVVVPDAATVRALAWTSPDLWQGRTLTVRLTPFSPPYPDWRPRMPALGTLRAMMIDHDPEAATLTVTLRLPDPAPLAVFAQAIAPMVEPLPSRLAEARAAIGVETPDPPALAPTLLAVPDPEGGDTRDATLAPWDLVVDLGDVPEPGSDAIARVHVRPARPLIDLTVHNPIARPPYRPARRASAEIDGGSIRVVTSGAKAGSAIVQFSMERPLTRQNVSALLRGASSLDCSGMASPPDDAAPHLTARLAELAATGVILHAVPPALTAGLDPALAAMARSPWDAGEALALEGELRSVRQRRQALRAHSAVARWFTPSEPLAAPPVIAAPEVSVVLATKRPDLLGAILPQIAAETYPRIEILVGIHGDADAPDVAEMAEWAGGLPLRVSRFPVSAALGVVLGRLSAMADGQLIAKMDDDDRYGPNHLADLVVAQAYSRADIVGLALWHRYYTARNLATAARRRTAEKYTHFVPGGTIAVTRGALADVGGWRPVPRSVDRGLLERMRYLGGLIYRTHGFGYVYCRHPDGHTWNPDEDATIAAAGDRWEGEAPVMLEAPGTFDPVSGILTPEARPTEVYRPVAGR